MRQRELRYSNTPTMNPRNTNQLRKLIEVRQVQCMWGPKDRHWITPRLVSRIYGDGRQLIALYPIMFRPNHFVIRIDSAMNTGGDEFRELLDEIYDDIYDEFFEWPWAKQYGRTWHEDDSADMDSRIQWSDGCAWETIMWPALKSRKRAAQAKGESND